MVPITGFDNVLQGDQVRSFVSIDVEDPQTLAQIESAISSLLSLGGDIKAVGRENIHLTLKFLGNVESSRLSRVKSALSKVEFSPFSAEIKGAGAFPSLSHMNVVWVGVSEGWSMVQLIYEQTEKFLSEVGFRRESREFSPHITIARVKSARHRDEIAGFLRQLEDKSFGSFKVESVRLKQSVLSSSGPKYSTLLKIAPKK